MLLGATGRLASRPLLQRAFAQGTTCGPWLEAEGATAAVQPWQAASLDAVERSARDPESACWLAFSGRPLLDGEGGAGSPGTATRLLERLSTLGLKALDEVDGSFAIAWFDARRRRLLLIRDRFGSEPLFYLERERSVLFASRLRTLRATGALPGGVDGQGLTEFLTYCYVPGDATLDRGVRRVPAASWIEVDPQEGVTARGRWYQLSFARPHGGDETEIASSFRTLLENAVVRRLTAEAPGILLSGGMDSSSVATFVRRHWKGPIHSFAFRCAGASYDESVYARALASELGTEHSEVEYGEREALEKREIVEAMDVPFCDVGINVGTWILGREARKRVSYVLTGDGGDEMWGSHPVYAAQRLMRIYDRVPLSRMLQGCLVAAAARLPDSDQKRDLRVKLKRFLPRAELPRALGHFRWRAYYAGGDLEGLLTPEAAQLVKGCDPYASVLAAYAGYDGPDDGLSPLLYNDYRTASSFYFSRLGLLRSFGIEARSPFYDRALVEYGARIPARLKLEGIERTKRLFRVAMEGVLADVINHRTDKLGHSVPLKNWLRQSSGVLEWVSSVLAPERVRARGLFHPESIQRMLEEHQQRRCDHSHRLWALAVLESWLTAHGADPGAA